jgi:hypothetical protein
LLTARLPLEHTAVPQNQAIETARRPGHPEPADPPEGQYSGEPPVARLQFMRNFVKGVDDLVVDGIFT